MVSLMPAKMQAFILQTKKQSHCALKKIMEKRFRKKCVLQLGNMREGDAYTRMPSVSTEKGDSHFGAKVEIKFCYRRGKSQFLS